LKSTDEDRIKSFEMKAFRQILKVMWTDRRTNERKTLLLWSCHVLRKQGNCMEKDIMQGTAVLLVKEDEEDQEHVGRIT